jgi:hypothetical protein
MVTHSKIVDTLYILHENMQFYIFKKYVSDKYKSCNFFNMLENTYLIMFKRTEVSLTFYFI